MYMETLSTVYTVTVPTPRTYDCDSFMDEQNIGFLNDFNLFFPDHVRHPNAAYLFSYGGSGNTITRIVLEYITHIWTGSVFNDQTLYNIGLKGELITCPRGKPVGPPVLVMKAHPEVMKPLRWPKHKNWNRPCLGFHHLNYPNNITNLSAVFIVRDPWKAMFALYQFVFGDEEGVDPHIRQKMLSSWNSNTTQWIEWVEREVDQWAVSMEFMNVMKEPNYSFIVVKYEHLINLNDQQLVLSEFTKILRFLYSDRYYAEKKEISMDRIRCIFPDLMQRGTGRFGAMHRKSTNQSVHLTFDEAYRFIVENRPDVLCRAWSKIFRFAEKYSYHMFPGVNCSAFD